MGLTMLRLLLLPVYLYLLLVAALTEGAQGYRHWAIGLFCVMAATDKLDGWLARRLNQTSKLGAILDPIADKLVIMSSIVLLNFERLATPAYAIPMWVVAVVYGKDLVVGTGTVALLTTVGPNLDLKARWPGKIATAAQLAMVLVSLIGPDLTTAGYPVPRGVLQFVWVANAVIAVVSCVDYVTQGFRMYFRHRAA